MERDVFIRGWGEIVFGPCLFQGVYYYFKMKKYMYKKLLKWAHHQRVAARVGTSSEGSGKSGLITRG